MRRSMFALDPMNTTRKFPVFHDIYANQFLFWSVVLGALSVFPAVYIPGLSRDVFKHTGITWEWAPAVLCVIIFVFGMEMWKLTKRRMGWFADEEVADYEKNVNKALSLRQGFFTMARSFTRTKSQSKSDSESTIAPGDGESRGMSRVKEEV